MLKKIILTFVVTIGLVAYTYGQGQVNFNTRTLGTSTYVYDSTVSPFSGYLLGSPSYGPGFQGTNFFAQLYAAAGSVSSSSSLSGIGNPVNFGSGSAAGWVLTAGTTTLGWPVNPVLNATTVNGGPATVQLRAWWGGGTVITSFEAAVASANPNSRYGGSPLLYLAATGNPNAEPPGTPVLLSGLQGFSLIPEPATWALAGLGAAALLLFRRRK
jgi:hypothetical protein